MKRLIASSCAVLLLTLSASCRDDPLLEPVRTPAAPKAPSVPEVLGLIEITVTGIGTDDMQTTAIPLSPETGLAFELQSGGGSDLIPLPTGAEGGLQVESVGSSSLTEGTRTQGGQRYLTLTYRVRNAQSNGTPYPAARSNITFIAVGTTGAIPGTAMSRLNRFDGTQGDTAIARNVVPTGAVYMDPEHRMRSPFPDVLQVFTEAEVSEAALPRPAGVTNVLPYGFVIRGVGAAGKRTLAGNPAPHQFDGLITFGFRIPLQPTSTQDAFSMSFLFMAVEDTQTRLTESIEEAQDSAAVRRLREHATALAATSVTVLNGSGRMDPAVPNYPGQRQVCSPRTAGTAAAPVTSINAPGAHSDFAVLTSGQTMDSCAAHFRTGTATRPATNVPFALQIRAVDRYGNTRAVADTVRVQASPASPPFSAPAAVALTNGVAELPITYTDYGNSAFVIRGRRLIGTGNALTVAGVVREWTGAADDASWHTGANWKNGAVPMQLDSVLIPTGLQRYPVLTQNVTIQGVTVENGATISLSAFDLIAGGNVATGTSGGISSTSGRLVLTGIARTVHGLVPRLRVTGTYTLTGNVTTRAPLQVDLGRITNSSFRIQATSF
jgi:hypothetical protein